jgi:hypothetical protein
MVPLTSPETEKLAGILSSYTPYLTITRAAGLLTDPSLQANTVRLEILVHLATAHCAGHKKPALKQLTSWLNKELGHPLISMLEDPVEDVFVTNVITPEGNRRIFEGIWESNDYFAQTILDILMSQNAPEESDEILISTLALLKLSETVAARVDLKRWHFQESDPKGLIRLPSTTWINKRAQAVTFNRDDLASLEITKKQLKPFLFHDGDKKNLINESTGHSSLERRPIIELGDKLVLALPNAVSPAIRRFALSEFRKMGYLNFFVDALAKYQAHQVENIGLRELKDCTKSLTRPRYLYQI